MPREFFQDLLEQSLGARQAARQLDILIDWGRYAELIAYDDESRTLYLEEEWPGPAAEGT
jgi:NitT/TauT family transport system ATP-binding protein